MYIYIYNIYIRYDKDFHLKGTILKTILSNYYFILQNMTLKSQNGWRKKGKYYHPDIQNEYLKLIIQLDIGDMIKRIKNIIPQKNSPKQDAMFRKLKEETSGFRTSVLPGGL